MIRTRRSDMGIIYDMLENIGTSEHGLVRMELFKFGNNLSYRQTRLYMGIMQASGMITVEPALPGERGKRYALTDRGESYMKHYAAMKEIMDEVP
ncbi:MAG: hypothetical protein HY365_01020 [Candidatus Aenigmarchaeota archaeon]|nr:hypothetical protein [Candidatus Aenigmarchaeota archaeon]